MSSLKSPRNSQLSLSQLPYQITKEQPFQRDFLISGAIRPSSPIQVLESNLFSDF